MLEGETRRSDIIGRYGGDEFVVLLPETDAEGAVAVAEKLRAKLVAATVHVPAAQLDRDGRERRTIPIRASIGVAVWDDEMDDREALFAAADRALYRAKRLGRGRVVLAAAGARA